jgi:hypothetical protein
MMLTTTSRVALSTVLLERGKITIFSRSFFSGFTWSDDARPEKLGEVFDTVPEASDLQGRTVL